MITCWDKSGNRCLSIKFDKFILPNIVRYTTNNAKKGIDSYIEKNLWLFGIKFTYIDVNYDDIVFINIKPENNYTKCPDSHEINVLKTTLNAWVTEQTYDRQYPPFNWNYFVRENGELEFFITGPKKYFEEHNMKSLVSPLREITFDDNEIYFPKYNPKETNKVGCISTYVEPEEEEE